MAGTSKQTAGRKDDKDYTSLLPDCLIHHIFSFLPTRDVVKTCVLSKSWRSVWTTISDLRFSVSSYDYSFVDRVLTLYEWAKAKKLHLEIRSMLIYPFQIDSWVCFANDHQVEELRLNLESWSDYTLSPLLYNCSSLTKLCFRCCRFSSNESISWSSLKSLSIHYMNVSDDVLQKIMMGSPVLEYLNLKQCYGVKGIHSTSLKELVIENNEGLRILTPRLLSLRVRGYYVNDMIRIVEAPSLIEAELADCDCLTISDFRLLKEMLCKMQNATRILLGSWWAWVMCPLKVEDVQVSLPNCKSLTLHLPVHDFGFHAVATMLATTPNLEKLVIILEPFSCSDTPDLESSNVDHESYWHIKKKFKRWARHLKDVEIFGFCSCLIFKYEEVFTLVKFLLGHAFVLENMVIKVMNGSQHLKAVGSHELHKVARRLQCYHRASEHAVVTLNYLEEEYGKRWKKGVRVTKKCMCIGRKDA